MLCWRCPVVVVRFGFVHEEEGERGGVSREGGGKRWGKRREKGGMGERGRRFIYLDVAVDVVHRLGLGGDVVLGGAGGGVVFDLVCHCGW